MKIPKEIDINSIVRKDSEKFVNEQKKVIERLKKSQGLEKFVYSWALIEQIYLPHTIKFILDKLSLNMVPNLEKISVAQLINYYYFLSHDADLYKRLVKGNNLRNKIVHDIYNTDRKNFEKDLEIKTKYVLKEILGPLLKRLRGDVPIPVLILYAKGWNDFRKKLLKYLDTL